MLIPRLIHQTITDKSTLDTLAIRNFSRIMDLNSGWQHRLYDEEDRTNFILERFGGDMLACYSRIEPFYGAARADLFRYLLLYELGGVYLDIKSTLTKPLDQVILAEDAYILSKWQNKPGQAYEKWGVHANVDGVTDEYQQWHIVCSPRHPFLEAVIKRVRKNIDTYDPFRDGVGKHGVMKLTGPVAYTAAISPIQNLHPHRLADVIVDMGFQYSIYPATTTNKYGHVAKFASHYSKRVDPIVKPQDHSPLRQIFVRALTLCRGAYRTARDLIKRVLGRQMD